MGKIRIKVTDKTVKDASPNSTAAARNSQVAKKHQ
jgi:hypothetical protein